EPSGKAVRETIESVVIAFVLAFMFRTFEAEAFVIPTGSMAPTLSGRHLDVTCPKCGYEYRGGASLNENWQSQASDPDARQGERDMARQRLSDSEPVAVTCPQCRYVLPVEPDTPSGEENPPYNGDRILVAKFPYDFGPPKRFDVFVFKYPGNAQVNYIKRLAGLPNESLRIYHGDLYSKPLDAPASDYQIIRKPTNKLLAMMQTVYDNDCVVDEMTAAGWPLRWQPLPAGEATGGDAAGGNVPGGNVPADAAAPAWKSADGGRSFSASPAADQAAWLRYQHFVATDSDWQSILEKRFDKQTPQRPQLITDFYSYNDVITKGEHGAPPNHTLGMNWVGDLKLDCELQLDKPEGKIVLELVKAGRRFRAKLDAATGQAELSIDGLDDFHPRATTNVRGPGRYQVAFANVDAHLTLWADGKRIQFDGDTGYTPLADDVPTAADLAPVGIGAEGASLTVRHLNLHRDVYYIAAKLGSSVITDYPLSDNLPTGMDQPDKLGEFLDFFSNPDRWKAEGPDGKSPFDERRSVEFDIGPDQFIALGDNSPY
ncbi:MAG TPA: S26 family signal peptidase, partial [Pirellulales bacterium]|nr:S26 family signal peptidase [Pirellulales bacterium]